MKEITVNALKEMLVKNESIQIIDVREPHEFEICHLNGHLIPMGEIPLRYNEIKRDIPVIIHCRSGARSANMVNWLEKNHQFNNLYNLKGGILAWIDQIDPSLKKY